ncbi:MAG: DUF5060 domain-containing protein [Planctomycetes bacterium]|nr:DUF5060 domain-containing protein [Planctomycetota bacterium]
MKRVSEFLLGVIAVGALGFTAFWLARDVHKTLRPQEEIVAEVKLPEVEDGWYPSPKEPIFAWEEKDGAEGWQLDADAPLELAQAKPQIVLPERDDPGDQPPDTEPPKPAADEEDTGPKEPGSLSVTTDVSNGPESHGCLKVPVNFPDPATIYRSARPLKGVRYIAYDVYVPPEAAGYVGCLFFLKDKDGLWYQARARQRLLPGKWTTVAANISGGSPDVTPLGHLGEWEENQASQIRTIGITFYGDRAYTGHICVDNFRGWMRADSFKRAVAALSKPDAAKDDAVPAERREALKKMAEGAALAAADPLKILNLRTDPMPTDSPPAVGLYQSFLVRFELNRQIYNPFDPDLADIRAAVLTPLGKKLEVMAYWYQDFERADRYNGDQLTPVGRPEWRVRFTPRETGEYKLRLSVNLKGEQIVTSPEIPFVAIPSPERGFVRVSKTDPNYFEFENGSFFYPVGFNFHTPIDVRCWSTIFKQEHPLFRGLPLYFETFPKMAAAGQNVCEVWMASWWLGIEWTRRWPTFHGAGRYSLENAWKLDKLLEEARKNGIRIHLAIDNHGKFSQWCDWEWDYNPYNVGSDGDGLVRNPTEFFTDERCRKLHKQRLRYVAARWAGDPSIMGFELVSEFDLVGDGRGGNPAQAGHGDRNYCKTPQARDWVKEMIAALRAYDVYGHPVTNHYASDFNIVDRELATSTSLDYIVGDAYRDQPGYASMAHAWMNAYGSAGKPYWVTEFGGNWNATSAPRLEADLHTGLWSTWLTNASATPLFWWYDFIDRKNQYPVYKAFADFIKGEDKRGLKGNTETVGFAAKGDGLAGMQYRWSLGTYLWIYDENAQRELPPKDQLPAHDGVVIYVPGLTEGTYRVEYWDTWAGKTLKDVKQTIVPGANLALQFPPFRGDVAVKVKRVKPNFPPPARTSAPEPSPTLTPPPPSTERR